MFLVRNWKFKEHKVGLVGGNAYITGELSEQDINEGNKEARQSIIKSFQKISGFLLPFPGSKINEGNEDSSASGINENKYWIRNNTTNRIALRFTQQSLFIFYLAGEEEKLFLEQLEESFRFILDEIQVKSLNPEQPLKAEYVYTIFTEFEKNCNENELPEVDASYAAQVAIGNQVAIAQTLEDYKIKITRTRDTIPKNTKDLFNNLNIENEKFKAEAISNFRNKSKKLLGGSVNEEKSVGILKQV